MAGKSSSFRPINFGQAIAHARTSRLIENPKTGKKKPMTQLQLAKLVGVTRATISGWETGAWKGLSKGNVTTLRRIFGDELQVPISAPDSVSLEHWRGRVLQIAKHMELVLREQEELAADMASEVPAELVYADDDARAATQSVADDAAAVGQPDAQTPARRKKSG